VVLDDPYHYGERDAPPVADLGKELVAAGRVSERPVDPDDLSPGGGDDLDPRPPIL
jgi:hypothetical protein